MKNQQKLTNENVRITTENVRYLSERIALSAVKNMMRYIGHRPALEKLYHGLVADIFHHKDYTTTFSDGYDLASEVVCFLCDYLGHELDDMICHNKRGQIRSIRYASIGYALRYIEKTYLYTNRTISMEECAPSETSVGFETEAEDTAKADAIIRQMRLTAAEEETVQYYLSGHGFVAIAKLQNVNNVTVWRRRKRIQRKYLEYVARI